MFVKKMHDIISQSLLNNIHQQAFNLELAQGILPQEKFVHYLIQDGLYLADFGKALAITAGRIQDNTLSQKFIQFALDTLNAERELQATQLKAFNVDLNQHEQSPACFMYCNYLFRMAALASVEEAVAAMLPCPWVYAEVGKLMASKPKVANNPYQHWIDFYASAEFSDSVNEMAEVVDKLAEHSSPIMQDKMIQAFIRATQLEWYFWDGAYQLSGWQVR